jgi:D-glycero-alpha-D-manno-heptose 1-phosphate guanylyltransferase
MRIAPHQLTAVILAGGSGTRLGPITAQLPKPMVPVADRPFLEWVIHFLRREGLRHILISAGFHAQVLVAFVQQLNLPNVTLECVVEPSPLGTAGGFRYVTQRAGTQPEAWLVLNGDSLVITSLAPLFACLADNDVSGALLGVKTEDRSRYGALHCDSQGRLLRFGEKQAGSPGLINAGVYLLRSRLADSLPQDLPLSFELDVFPNWLREGVRLKTHPCQAPFLDIGTPESLAAATSFVARHKEELLGG